MEWLFANILSHSTFKSSTKTFRNLSMYAPKTPFMVLEKVLIAFFMSKGMIVQLNNPNLVIKAY
jgi:hypothetical protein